MADGIVGKVSVGDGATFTPSVSSSGILSWTNNKNLPNPEDVNIAQAVLNSGAGLFLPLTGGTMTGAIKVSGYLAANANNSSDVRIAGGTSVSNGAALTLNGKDTSGVAGRFTISANDGTNVKYLIGRPDGILSWDGNNIVTAKVGNFAIGKAVDNGFLQLNGGSLTAKGANLLLFGVDDATRGGYFRLVAQEEQTKTLEGKPDGTLLWDGKEIERVNASGTNYIRYENGLQICWGNNQAFDADATPIALPVAFKDATYAVMLGGRGVTDSTNFAISKITAKTTTNFTIRAVATNNLTTFIASTIDYVAIGWWK